jgi:hypothetical protein
MSDHDPALGAQVHAPRRFSRRLVAGAGVAAHPVVLQEERGAQPQTSILTPPPPPAGPASASPLPERR